MNTSSLPVAVPPHGVEALSHPERDFYIVGVKSYGRAPTFLMLTGYEQMRSVVGALVGDHAAAREVHLELPATGVCNSGGPSVDGDASSGCCAPVFAGVIDLDNLAVLERLSGTPVAICQ